MSNLIPTPIVDKNGKHTTVRKRPASAANASALSVPSPAVAAPQQVLSDAESRVKNALSQHMKEEDAEGLATYIGRRSPLATELCADFLEEDNSQDAFELSRALLNDFAHNPRYLMLVLDDPKFVMALEEPLRGKNMYNGETKYSRALSAVEEAFTPAFRNRANETRPEDFNPKKYGPIFRASVLTKMLRLNESAPTYFDEHEQMVHVRDNQERIMKHLTACKKSADIMAHKGMMPTSQDMLEISDLMDEFPNRLHVLEGYLNERERFHMDELYDIVSSDTPALSEGVL